MKKILLLFIVCLSINNNVFAQQIPQFGQYQSNIYLYNPAFGGAESFTDLKTGIRQQWAGIDGAPLTAFISVNGAITSHKNRQKPKSYMLHISNPSIVKEIYSNPTKPKLKHGLGGNVVYDRIGAYNQFQAMVSYALHIPIGQFYLSVSPTIGLSNIGISTDGISMIDPGDPLYQEYLGDGGRFTHMNLGAGIAFYGERLFVGYSIRQLLQNPVYFGNNSTQAGNVFHHFINMGYTFRLSRKIELQPSAFFKLAFPGPFTFDLTLRVRYNKMFWAGAAYRYNNSVAALLGVNIKNIVSIGYCFDFPYNMLRSNNYGSHELVLGIQLFNKNKSDYKILW